MKKPWVMHEADLKKHSVYGALEIGLMSLLFL